jgi:phage-related protein
MESWMPFFVIVIALTVVLQSVVLIVLFLNLRRTAARIDQIVTDLNARMSPILSNLQRLVEDLSPRISSVVSDAAEITHLARNQTQKVDRIVSEILERLRLQIIHVDHLITGAMDVVEEAGSRVKQTVWGPVVQVGAVVRGIQTGLNFWRNMRRAPEPVEEPRERQDKGMVV